MANFTDPHRQGWPVIRSPRHRACAFTDATQDLPADLGSPPGSPAWQAPSFDPGKGLDLEEGQARSLLRELFKPRP
jgi:hypothetical protein